MQARHWWWSACIFGEDTMHEPAEKSESVVGNAGQRANLVSKRHKEIVAWSCSAVTSYYEIGKYLLAQR
jgi:hypothetical protein